MSDRSLPISGLTIAQILIALALLIIALVQLWTR